MKFHFPGGKELSDSPGAWGKEVRDDADNSRMPKSTTVTPHGRSESRRPSAQWPQARREDFEKIGKRLYRDRATGIEYMAVLGAVLLGIGTETTRNISAFFVDDGRLTFLRRADIDPVLTVWHGPVEGRQIITTHGLGSGIQ